MIRGAVSYGQDTPDENINEPIYYFTQKRIDMKFQKDSKIKITDGRRLGFPEGTKGTIDQVDTYDTLTKYPYLIVVNGGFYWADASEMTLDLDEAQPTDDKPPKDNVAATIVALILLLAISYLLLILVTKYGIDHKVQTSPLQDSMISVDTLHSQIQDSDLIVR